jgi:FkbM family methyltransferase
MPYSLLDETSTIVQVGAPADTLMSGRSRAMHFALIARRGKVVVVEPDQASADLLGRLCADRGLEHVSIHAVGAWSSKKRLKLFVDPRHPATNFTEGMTDYDSDRMADFLEAEVEVDTLDNILSREGVEDIDLLSITTNGAELEIIEGLGTDRPHRIRHLALARTGVVGDDYIERLGFDNMAFDDRGNTYRRRNANRTGTGQASGGATRMSTG